MPHSDNKSREHLFSQTHDRENHFLINHIIEVITLPQTHLSALSIKTPLFLKNLSTILWSFFSFMKQLFLKETQSKSGKLHYHFKYMGCKGCIEGYIWFLLRGTWPKHYPCLMKACFDTKKVEITSNFKKHQLTYNWLIYAPNYRLGNLVQLEGRTSRKRLLR